MVEVPFTKLHKDVLHDLAPTSHDNGKTISCYALNENAVELLNGDIVTFELLKTYAPAVESKRKQR